jgi:hypothetical protein
MTKSEGGSVRLCLVAPPEGFLTLLYDSVIDEKTGFEESLDPSWLGHLLAATGQILVTMEPTERLLRAEKPKPANAETLPRRSSN